MFEEIMDSSIVLKKKTSISILIFIFILAIFFIIFLLLIINYKYNIYSHYLGYITGQDENYYISLYVADSKIEYFMDSDLILDKIEKEYKILEISEDYYLLDNTRYHLIILESNLDDKYKIENNIINLTIRLEETTLLKQIKKGLKL